MKTLVMARTKASCSVLLQAGIILICMLPLSHAYSLAELRVKLPSQIDGWTAAKDRLFDNKTIFSYINGAGEVYRAYNLRQCLSRRFSKPNQPAIILDIFDMGSAPDAFGVFTHDTEGEVLDVGQDARYRPGWLSFWQHRFFVSIYMEEESTAAEKAVKELGRQVATRIGIKGRRPPILTQLPRKGLVTGSIRYLHHPVVLNYHYYVADENILNLTPHTDAVLAAYRHDKGQARLLIVAYPDSQTAEKALSGFLRHYLPDADRSGTALLENGKWAAALTIGQMLAIVLEADTRSLAENLLQSVRP
jgi:hypothetical protein